MQDLQEDVAPYSLQGHRNHFVIMQLFICISHTLSLYEVSIYHHLINKMSDTLGNIIFLAEARVQLLCVTLTQVL